MSDDAARTRELIKRIKQLGDKSTQVLIFLSFAFLAVITLKSGSIAETQQKSLTYALRFWASALPFILIGVFPIRDFVEHATNKIGWYNRIRWFKVGLLIVAVVLILFGAWYFGSAIWPLGHVAVTTITANQNSQPDNSLYRAYLWATIIGVSGGFVGIGLIVWQVKLLGKSADAAAKAAVAAKASTEALINSERAWLIAELMPTAAIHGKVWHRLEGDREVVMGEDELLAGHHLRHRLKFTNAGKTPAHILSFQINVGGHVEERDFDYWLVAGASKEIFDPIVNINRAVEDSIRKVGDANQDVTVGIQIFVEYQHVFSEEEKVENGYFQFIYHSSTGRLTTLVMLKSDGQDDEEQDEN